MLLNLEFNINQQLQEIISAMISNLTKMDVRVNCLLVFGIRYQTFLRTVDLIILCAAAAVL
ncbi:hypothetical protein X975_23818, partial [Stegodyphus mimosarum]